MGTTTADLTGIIKLLKESQTLAPIPEEQLEWLAGKSDCVTLQSGEHLFVRGTKTTHLQVVLDGHFTIQLEQNGEFREVGQFGKGDITGVLPYSRLRETTGYGTATEKSHVLRLHMDHFPELIRDHHELATALVHYMMDRVRSFTTLQLQNEKLMSLGKLSAGLAHELNNPASAIVRSASSLQKHLQAIPEGFKKVIKIRITDDQVDGINELIFDKINAVSSVNLSLMERTEREEDIADMLEEHGFEDGMDIASTLVDFDFTIDDLEGVMGCTTEAFFMPVVNWINQNLITEKMVRDIAEASERISGLVKSVKSYTHMDQTVDRQPVDLHDGIRNTIKILEHKVRKGNVQIVEDFSSDVAKVPGFPGELNQMWTNILDNAIDAVCGTGQTGEIVVKTRQTGSTVEVRITDNGPGIPEDVLSRIFDPFFTTKPMGEGTGLGLDLVNKIVIHHKARIEVNSEPGNTEFLISLPTE